MTYDVGYFYMFDDGWDTLVQKLADGNTAFSYPLSDVIGNEVISLEYDGVNFWTLQDPGAGTITIDRWKIENDICALKDSFDLSTFDSDTFTVEHYHTDFDAIASVGSSTIQVNKYYDTVIVSGTVLTLGPNSISQSEDITVSSVSGTNITLASGIQYDYEIDDEINFYNNLWVFNNTGNGTLHKINARTGANITTYSGTEYDNITACTFARVSNVDSSTVDSLVYVKSTNLKYLNINTLANYGIMIIDNLKADNATIITVYDLAIDGNNIYRLQTEAKYFETNYNWTYYNYVNSTVRRFLDTVSMSAYPLILPNNGFNTTELTVLVDDQFGDGVVDKPVSFTDTDSVGFVTINPAYTDLFFGTGEAISYYKAGIVVATVTITATSTQYD